ncbi:YadA-like family protein [Paraburkholderia adhaesiva]|uniref:YadA-like family protein n=1 Tax=Paraburkholderia adhaesiva TaxID=2883244 RepID=UPI001F21E261|nr:YadA-like family protein [Paraburkholderia adhaesiva]
MLNTYQKVNGLNDGVGSTPVSDPAQAAAAGAIAIGSQAYTTGTGGVALGVQAYAQAKDSVALGMGSVANQENTVSVGTDGTGSYVARDDNGTAIATIQNQANTRRIVNMAAGQGDTDAVNVSQLKGATDALGGGAGVNADGSIKAPSYSVSGGTYSDVGSALQAVDGAAQAGLAEAVKYDSSAHDKVTLGGEGSGTPVKLLNVAVGTLSASSTDAVNGSQLYATNQKLDQTTGDVTNIQSQLADAVAYDSSAHDKVTLGGVGSSTPVKLLNVAVGTLSASSTDAVNGSQLYATNQKLDQTTGDVTNIQSQLADAVAYDSSAHDKVTLGGVGSSTPVKLLNVAVGTLSASSTDAVNGSQLYATNQKLDQTTGDVTNIQSQLADAVAYDSSAHDKVTLGGVGSSTPVKLLNVAVGTLSASSTDAVNGSQLYATNQKLDQTTGDVTNIQSQLADAVAYDSSAHDKVTLGGVGSNTPVKLLNVEDGTLSATSTDAVNGSQLYATNQKLDQTTGDVTNIQSQLADAVVYDSSAHDKLTLGGVGSATPVTLHNVAPGNLSATSTDAVNGSQLYATNQKLDTTAGDVTDIQSQLADAVLYDSSAHDSVTLGSSGVSPVVLRNVAAGISSNDAVNVGQLTSAGFQLDNSGAVLNQAATYDVGSITAGNPTITLNPGTGNSVYYRNGNRNDGLLPTGTRISNVATGILDTDAANVGQVHDIVNASSNSQGQTGATLMSATMLAPQSDGSGVDVSGRTWSFDMLNTYQKVNGLNDGVGSTPVSDPARATAAGAIAIGSQAYTTGTGGVALGVQAYAQGNDSVALGAGSVANQANTVSVGTDGTGSYQALDGNGALIATIQNQPNTRRIVNMAAGQGDTDAVNVSQLKGVTDALGGGAGVNADGSIKAPSYSFGGKTYGDVGSALQAVDDAAQAGLADAVAYDSSAHDKVTLGGVGWGTPVKLLNVAAGTVSASSTDAVNGSQLYGQAASTASALGGGTKVNSDGTLSAPSYDLGSGTGTYSDVGSALTAVAALARGGSVDAVVYDTSAHDKLTLGGTSSAVPVQLTNVAKATTASDAVNLEQLQEAGLSVDSSGNVTNAFVAYDDSTKKSVTFGGTNPSAPVALHNVAAGAQGTDAVNVSQLEAAGLAIDSSGNVTNAFVAYDDTNKDSVTLGGKGSNLPVGLHNVANATSASDAVNLAQLQQAGLDVDASGNVTNAFVAYDSTDKKSVTFGGLNPSAPVELHNVAAGAVSASSSDAVNGSQLYGLAASTATALGGATKVNADGSLSAPSYDVQGAGTYSDVGSALDAVAALARGGSADAVLYDTSAHDKLTLGGEKPGAPAVQLTNVANATGASDAVNLRQLQQAGLDVDSSGNVTNAFVAYDDTNKDSVTLGGKGTNVLVGLHNVANATSAGDAVNLAQLQQAGLDVDSSGNVTNAFVAYDNTDKKSVTFGGPNSTVPVGLHNVAAGAVSASSFDGVNGSQLYGLAASTASALGGATKVNSDGTLSAPSYNLQGAGTYSDVGSALDAVAALARGGSADAVLYDTSAHDKLTLGGEKPGAPAVQLTNVANATEASDAVNLRQLQQAGLTVDSSGNVTNSFVAYDDSSKDMVTFGGKGSTTPVTLRNVANATQASDAVNLAQFEAAGLTVDSSGNVTNAFVTYDDASKAQITLGGSGGTVITNVKDGSVNASSTDAVNGSQLYAIKQQLDSSGLGLVMQNDEGTITVGANTNGNLVDFSGTSGPRTLTGVAGGSVNATSNDAVNGAQLYGAAQSTASALGGGSTVNPDGTVTAPTYKLGDTTVNNVGDALTNLDGRVTNLQNTVTNIAGAVANAVQYDSSAHDLVTLGGAGSASTVKLTNLTDADLSATSTDAVTGAQLYATNQELANLGNAIQNIGDTGSQYLSTNSNSGPADATGDSSIAAGGGATASGSNSTALGDKAAASADNSVALGGGATGSGSNSTALGANAAASADNSVALGANSVADRANTVSVGSAGNERQITNVADGKAPTDAVNMRQFQSGMTSVQRGAYGGVAAATALTMIPDVDPGKTIAVGIGTANYKGYQATALGASARITQNIKVKMGAGYSAGGGTTVGGGMSYQW